MTEPKIQKIISESRRQEENCLYSSVSLFVWYKYARVWKAILVLAPIILGGFAGLTIISEIESQPWKWAQAISAFLASMFPAAFVALNLNVGVSDVEKSAKEFNNLRDRFRQLADIYCAGSPEDAELRFEDLMDRMDHARMNSVPVPEWCFKKAQKKVATGDYSYDTDVAADKGSNVG